MQELRTSEKKKKRERSLQDISRPPGMCIAQCSQHYSPTFSDKCHIFLKIYSVLVLIKPKSQKEVECSVTKIAINIYSEAIK